MKRYFERVKLNNRGFTLVELVMVIPLIAIVFILGYNMLFLGQRAFTAVNRTFDVTEELRIFQLNIHNEANQAKKAEESKDVLNRISGTEIQIYTDVDNSDGKNIPELVRYRIDDGSLKRSVKNPTGTAYPYTYTSAFGTEEIVLRNIVEAESTFYAQEPVRVVDEDSQESPDYRMKLRMKLVIDGEPNDIEVQGYLVTKSRTEAE